MRDPSLRSGSIRRELRMTIKLFIIDYMDRHKHPLNACLHIFGVPCVLGESMYSLLVVLPPGLH